MSDFDTKVLEKRLRARARTRAGETRSLDTFMEWQAADALSRLRAERDEARAEAQRQYDENVNRIAAEGAALLRAEAAEARVEELTRERDELKELARLNRNFLSDAQHRSGSNIARAIVAETERDTFRARLEEAKAVLAFYAAKENWWNDETSVNKQELFDVPMGDDLGDKARSFLHQGGEDAR